MRIWDSSFMYWENGFTVLGLGFNHWERHEHFLKEEWDFSPFTIFDYII